MVDQDEYADHTWYEQLEDGRPWTNTKKFLFLAPTILFLVTEYNLGWESVTLPYNFIVLVIVLVPKFPEMHGKRLLGVNRTENFESDHEKIN